MIGTKQETVRMMLKRAAKRSAVNAPIARGMAREACSKAANDNSVHSALDYKANHVTFEAALRHFGQHGLGAAREARKRAESAFFAGDRSRYDHWLNICRTLDRRLARMAANEIESTQTRPIA